MCSLTNCSPLWLASFIYCHILKVHPCYVTSLFYVFLFFSEWYLIVWLNHLSIHELMELSIILTFWLLIILLCTIGNKLLCEHVFLSWHDFLLWENWADFSISWPLLMLSTLSFQFLFFLLNPACSHTWLPISPSPWSLLWLFKHSLTSFFSTLVILSVQNNLALSFTFF